MTGRRSAFECPCLSKVSGRAALQLAEVVLGVDRTESLIKAVSSAGRPGGLVQ